MANDNCLRRESFGQTPGRIALMLIVVLLYSGCSTLSPEAPPGSPPVTGTPLSGEQSGILYAGSSPYRVTGDLTVLAGEDLIIEPGVELRFDGLFKFVVLGHLEAIGTPEANIIFTSGQGSLETGDFGQWRAIIFDTGEREAAGDTSVLAYCQIKFGAVWDSTQRYPDSTGLWQNGAVICWNSSPTIRNCNVLFNGYHGIYAIGQGSQPQILNNIIYENDGDGIRCEPLPGQAVLAVPEIWYNDSKENNARQFADVPAGIGENTRVNANGDSCDIQFNMIKDPMFVDFEAQDYSLDPCSPCIAAGPGEGADRAMLGSVPYYIGATELRGDIGGRVITAAGNPWTVTCDIFVDPGESLTIETGSLVVVQGVYGLRVSGLIQAEGATFITEDSTNQAIDWLGIELTPEAEPLSYIRNCRLANASTYQKNYPFGGVITVAGTVADISHNTFENCTYAAITCQHLAEPTISYNVIDGFGPVAINCFDNSSPSIHHNVIRSGMGYGILCEFFSSPVIEANIIYATGHVGIKCDNFSAPAIQYNTIVQNIYAGLLCWTGSDPAVRNNIVAFNGSAATWLDTTHGNGLGVAGSSFPGIQFNDFYQAEGAIFSSGLSPWPDNTNIIADPLFEDLNGGDFHLQSGSPALTAGEDGGEVGAYGQGDWD